MHKIIIAEPFGGLAKAALTQKQYDARRKKSRFIGAIDGATLGAYAAAAAGPRIASAPFHGAARGLTHVAHATDRFAERAMDHDNMGRAQAYLKIGNRAARGAARAGVGALRARVATMFRPSRAIAAGALGGALIGSRLAPHLFSATNRVKHPVAKSADAIDLIKRGIMSVDEARAQINLPSLAKAKAPGQYGSKQDAGYADPGYRNGMARYPLKSNGKLDPERIKAAWDYIHVAKNQAGYTSAQVSMIKSRIIRAWKAAIDPKGPPAAQGVTA